TDLDLVTTAQLCFVDRFTVDVGAVEATDVANTEAVTPAEELHVATRNGHVVQEDVAVGVAAGGGHIAVQKEAAPCVGAAPDHEQGRSGRKRVSAALILAPGLLPRFLLVQDLDTGDRDGGCDVSGGVPRPLGPRALLFGPADGGTTV